MTQILDRVWQTRNSILCCYVNNTNQIQIGRITNISNWWFERVIFPGQRLLFEAVPDAQLEIYTGTTIASILSDKISCDHLAVHESLDCF